MLPNVMEMCTCTVHTEPLREPEEGGVPRVTIRPFRCCAHFMASSELADALWLEITG